MQTAKEYQEQLEWFWLLCQEEAWQEDQVVYQLIEVTTTEGIGRSYRSERVVGVYTDQNAAEVQTFHCNKRATPWQYYYTRKVEN